MSTTRYIVDNQSEQTINNEPILRPYKVFTALLTQNGISSVIEIGDVNLTIGVTYEIFEDSPSAEGFDFTNVGAPNNNLGTLFVATGTTPNSWGNNNVRLRYNEGAPVVTVLENTIGNIWFTYNGVGSYSVWSNSLFLGDKTTCITSQSNLNASGTTMIYRDGVEEIYIETYDFTTQIGADSILAETMLEVRVYNTPELPS